MRALLALLRYVSAPEIAARPIRSLLMIGTIAVGVALLTAMHVATESIVTGFAGDLERLGGKADLQITFGTGEAGFPEELLEKVAAMPFVARAAALVRSQVTFVDGQRETVEMFGLDLMQQDILDLYEVEVLERDEGDFQILDDPRGIFVTDVIAKERGLRLGSKVKLSAVDGVHEYTVHGIVATKGLAAFLGGRLVAMFLPAAQPVAGKAGNLTVSMIDQIDVQLRQGADLAAAEGALSGFLAPGFHAAPPMQRGVAGERTVAGLQATLVGMSWLALLAAVFIVYASTTTVVAQRLASMATLVTVGASPSALVRAVVIEAGILGVIGSLVGTGLGLALASFIGEDAAAGMQLNYSVPFDASRLAWSPLTVLVLHPMGGILTAAVSAYLPARRLRLVTPLVLQRGEDSELHRSMLSLPAALGVAGIAGLTGVYALVRGLSRGSSDFVSAGGILIICASVLAMLPVLSAAWRASIGMFTRWLGLAARIAGENLIRSMDRSLVTASAITLSVAIAVGAGSLVESFRESVAGWYGFSGDVLVSSRSVTGGWLAAPIPRGLEVPLRQVAGVSDVQTLRVLQGQPFAGQRIAVAGLSDGLLRQAIGQGRALAGASSADAAVRVAAGEAVAVSQNFVAHFGLSQQDPVLELATVTGALRLPVAAVVADYVSDKGSVLVAERLLETRWQDRLINYYAVTLAEGVGIDSFLSEVRRGIPGSDALAVVPTSRMIERVDGLIGEAFADIDTIKLLVLFLTAVGIADLVISNLLARRREMAVLRLVGLTDSQIVRTARIEGVCVTLGAALCGTIVGLMCAWIWVNYNYPALVGYVLELRIAWGSVLVSLVVAAVSASVASTLAARYVLMKPALSVIRFE